LYCVIRKVIDIFQLKKLKNDFTAYSVITRFAAILITENYLAMCFLPNIIIRSVSLELQFGVPEQVKICNLRNSLTRLLVRDLIMVKRRNFLASIHEIRDKRPFC